MEMKSIFFILNLLAVIIRRKGKDENKKGEKHEAIFIKKKTKIRDRQYISRKDNLNLQSEEIERVALDT